MDTDTLCKLCCFITLVGFLAASASVYVTFVPEHVCKSDSFVIYVGMEDRTDDEIKIINESIGSILSDMKMSYTQWVAEGSYYHNDNERHNHTLVYKFIDSNNEIVEEVIKTIQKTVHLPIFKEIYHSHEVELILPE